jgi:signal transduction histidine kinase
MSSGSPRAATSPTVSSARARSLDAVAGPTPHSRSTGSGCRNSASHSGGTTNSPSGFAERLAILASTFVRATPTLSGSPTCSRTSRRRRAASSAPVVAAPVASRNASSIDAGSTIGTWRLKISTLVRTRSGGARVRCEPCWLACSAAQAGTQSPHEGSAPKIGVVVERADEAKAARHAVAARDHELLSDFARAAARMGDARPALGETARRLLDADAVMQFAVVDNELVTCVTTDPSLAAEAVAVDDPASAVSHSFREQRLVFVGGNAQGRAVLAAPVTRGEERLGVLWWLWRSPRPSLSDREQRLAELVCAIKGLLVGRWEMLVEMQELSRAQIRTAVARDLAHSIANDLAVVRMSADASVQAVERDPKAVAALLPIIATHAVKLGEEISEVLRVLRATRPAPADLGLTEVVAPVIADFRRSSPDIALTLHATVGYAEHVRPAIRETVYFVLREALDSAARHSGPTRVIVDLRVEADGVALMVQDDGGGVESDATAPPDGLRAMLERTKLARGELDVNSLPGQGTRVMLRIPHPRPARAGAGA